MAAWAIVLGVSSCSVVLDWSGYTGGEVHDADATDEGEVEDARAEADTMPDADDAGSAPDVVDAAGAPDAPEAGVIEASLPPCGPTNCGGCCNANGFCAGGGSAMTCGTGGEACRDCMKLGQSCDQGVCSWVDSGPAPMCTETQCRTMLTLCAPVYEGACCLPDGTCGCQVLIPSTGQCM
jgi:hypothetical protein